MSNRPHGRTAAIAATLLAFAAGAAHAADMKTSTKRSLTPDIRVPAHDGLNGTLWTQSSAEYRANVHAIYALARIRLDQALADESWTALPAEQTGDYETKPPAVILDLDETVLDNSPYQAWLVKADTVFTSESWAAFVASKTSRAVPGALDFVDYATSKGVTVVYISNRSHEEEPATIENMKALGFPVDDKGRDILTRGETAESDTAAKAPRRQAVAEVYRVLLNIGDNMADFTDEAAASPADRRKAFTKHQARWGKTWLVIPNPSYGSWEAATFGFDYSLPDTAKRKRKLDTMEAWTGPE